MNTAIDTPDHLAAPNQGTVTGQPHATADGTRATTPPPRLRTPLRRTISIVAATITLLAGLVTATQAEAAGFDVAPYEGGLFYANFDQEVLLFAGATTEDFCNGDLPTLDSRVFSRRDGSIDIMVDAARQPIYLYSSPLGAPELIDATCEALLNGDPDTAPLQPFAEGEGLVRVRLEVEPDGTVHVVNSTVGAASSADGTTWMVRGWADLMIVDDVPVGDPSEFQGLRVTKTGR